MEREYEIAELAVPGENRPARTIVLAGLVALAYLVGAKIGFILTPPGVAISTFWPPNAILLAGLLLAPVRTWWVFLFAVLPVHLFIQLRSGVPILTALGWFVGNTGEALIGAALVRYFKRADELFASVRGVVVFLLCVALAAPLITSFIDAAVVVTTGWGSQFWTLWTRRLFSNMLAELTLVPAIVIFWLEWKVWIRKLTIRRGIEAAALIAGILFTSTLAFTSYNAGVSALIYLPVPFLIWATVRFGFGGLSVALLVLTLTSMWNVVNGFGPSSEPIEETVLFVQILLCAIAVPWMLLAGFMVERRHAEESLRAMSGRLIEAQEQERKRIAQELHDDLGQQLALLAIDLDKMRFQAEGVTGPKLAKLSEQVITISRGAQEISRSLYPAHLKHFGLATALKNLCADHERPGRLSVRFEGPAPATAPPDDASLCLYRVAQEALHNIEKHSLARNVKMQLSGTGSELLLQVVDDGMGFEAEQRTKGLGLASMRERVASVGGKLDIESAPNRGTRIKVAVPLSRE